jgi:hypothetical protein
MLSKLPNFFHRIPEEMHDGGSTITPDVEEMPL